jgi:hypothetical protein
VGNNSSNDAVSAADSPNAILDLLAEVSTAVGCGAQGSATRFKVQRPNGHASVVLLLLVEYWQPLLFRGNVQGPKLSTGKSIITSGIRAPGSTAAYAVQWQGKQRSSISQHVQP